MEKAFLVTVRFYTGRYHGTGDWPPSPARLFQALLAGAARGMNVPNKVRDSLDWLECLPPPAIAAPHGELGKGYTSFVPNNDLDAALSGGSRSDLGSAVASTRVGKQIRPILFNPDLPVLYRWYIDKDCEHIKPLMSAVHGLYQLGRGVDMAWAEADIVSVEQADDRLQRHGGRIHIPSGGGTSSGKDMLCPRPGSRRSLTLRFEAMGNRFRPSGSKRKPKHIFVQPPKPHLAKHSYDAPPAQLLFELREGSAKAGQYAYYRWRLDAVSQLIEGVRDRAAKCLCDAVPEMKPKVERYLIGRRSTEKDKLARVKIVPIPSIGHSQADMAIRRIVVQVPQVCPITVDDLRWAFSQVAWTDDDGVVIKELQVGSEGDAVAKRYISKAQRWRSVTPLALPIDCGRHSQRNPPTNELLGDNGRLATESKAMFAVHKALRHTGLNATATSIRVQKEPFDRHGARAELFALGTRFSRDVLWHVDVSFKETVKGPLVLGNGRYLGLGLMRPIKAMRGVVAFEIEAGLVEEIDPAVVARAARRAMIARVQAVSRSEMVPTYISGHQDDGSPAGDGHHRHIAVVADLPRRRILFISPDRFQRKGVYWSEVRMDHRKTEHALENMEVLRAGKAGRLNLIPAVIDEENDPVFASARVWESVTSYDITRHHRHLSDEDALRKDLMTELQRIDFPRLNPAGIDVIEINRGPRGGLSGRFRLTFATAKSGPLLIGRSMHRGGGLFAALR